MVPHADWSEPDWARVELPSAWPDQISWRRPGLLLRFFAHALGVRSRVVLPPTLPGAERIPAYALEAFHDMPNGNYSKNVCKGYARGFDIAMLGAMQAARARIASALAGSERVLDVGCGAGQGAFALREAGVPQVIGLEPSPYLLQLAATRYPGIRWMQGVVERIELADASLDGVSISFVLHELPAEALRAGLRELARVSKPGATLCILEPSPLQLRSSAWTTWRQFGWRGLYYWLLARRVHEPHVRSWHAHDVGALLAEVGFTLHEDEASCPFRFMIATRRAQLPA